MDQQIFEAKIEIIVVCMLLKQIKQFYWFGILKICQKQKKELGGEINF